MRLLRDGGAASTFVGRQYAVAVGDPIVLHRHMRAVVACARRSASVFYRANWPGNSAPFELIALATVVSDEGSLLALMEVEAACSRFLPPPHIPPLPHSLPGILLLLLSPFVQVVQLLAWVAQ